MPSAVKKKEHYASQDKDNDENYNCCHLPNFLYSL